MRAISLAVWVLLGAAQLARAAEPPPMPNAMHDYFAGEKQSGWWWAGAGVVGMGAGVALLAQGGDRARGASWPLLGIGAVQLIAGAVLLTHTDARVAKLDEELRAAPDKFADAEGARVEQLGRTFTLLVGTEVTVVAVGVGLAAYGFAAPRDVFAGLGVGLALEGGAMLGLDGFASRRAARYGRALDVFAHGK